LCSQFLIDFMLLFIACLSKTVRHMPPVSANEPPRFCVFIFSSFFFSRDRRFPRAQVCRGGWNKDIDRALIQGNLALPGGKQRRGDLAGGKQTTKS
jgi:hypothetical protein